MSMQVTPETPKVVKLALTPGMTLEDFLDALIKKADQTLDSSVAVTLGVRRNGKPTMMTLQVHLQDATKRPH